MQEEFMKYLNIIGMEEGLCERVERIYEFYREVCPEKITGIFVTDYITKDGSREYENLWFFSDKYIMEAKKFVTEDNFDVAPIYHRIFYWTIKKDNYDFKKATEKSRVNLHFLANTGLHCDFKASKGNCDYLKKIIVNLIIPNLKE